MGNIYDFLKLFDLSFLEEKYYFVLKSSNIFKHLLIINWKIIALWYCLGFCRIAIWISHMLYLFNVQLFVTPMDHSPTGLSYLSHGQVSPWDYPGKNTGVGHHFLPPGSSIHGIFQARVLEWGAIAFSGHVSLQQCKNSQLSISISRSVWPDSL